jgi:hypothetical protein
LEKVAEDRMRPGEQPPHIGQLFYDNFNAVLLRGCVFSFTAEKGVAEGSLRI